RAVDGCGGPSAIGVTGSHSPINGDRLSSGGWGAWALGAAWHFVGMAGRAGLERCNVVPCRSECRLPASLSLLHRTTRRVPVPG
ncbi:MAG: hypothetical protein D6725_13435, partial [Planctomycetota bacterium]